MRRPLPTELAAKLGPVRPAGAGYSAKCPAHQDNSPSLSVSVKDDGKVLLKCHAGCAQQDVLAALDIAPEILNPNRDDRPLSTDEWTPRGPAVAVYDYRDHTGKLLFQVLRTADKQFSQRQPDLTAKSGWKWNLTDVDRVLYRLPELIQAVNEGKPVYIAEGEKDVEALRSAGHAATCNPGGAGKWRDEYNAWLAGCDVTIIADKDSPGQAHARRVADALADFAEAVRIAEAGGDHKDAAAHLAAGMTIKDFVVTRGEPSAAQLDLAPGIHDLLAEPEPDHRWVVPGLLEHGDRLMLTGFEGTGKSFLFRQLAVAFSAGLHPFDGRQNHRCTPQRVLFIDCENSRRQTRRQFRKIVPLAGMYGATIDNDYLRLIIKPEGVDLTRLDDAAWLLERVTAHKPDVLFIGSLYRLHEKNPNDELVARAVTVALDRARTTVDCAVVIEAHAGHGNGIGHRSVRPLGSSLYMRWPEFGYGLAPFEGTNREGPPDPLELAPWRGARDERHWPRYLKRGDYDEATGMFRSWPWVEHFPGTETNRIGASA